METKNVEGDIRRNIEIQNNRNLRAKTSTIDMIAKEIKYYNCCRLKYNKEAKALSPKKILIIVIKIFGKKKEKYTRKPLIL